MRRRHVRHMRDQRIERGAALGVIEARYSFAIPGIRAQPINRLGRECGKTAMCEHADRSRDGAIAGFQDLRRKLRGHCCPVSEWWMANSE